jgi:hypothetical protein
VRTRTTSIRNIENITKIITMLNTFETYIVLGKGCGQPENLFLRGFLTIRKFLMIKILSVLSLAVLTACGGNNPEPSTVVKLPEPVSLPAPFVIGPSVTVGVPSIPVVGPGPMAQLPFVIGPVKGREVTITPSVVIGPSPVIQPAIKYCTDGFVVGPCVTLPTTCQPDASGFVIGPCTQ